MVLVVNAHRLGRPVGRDDPLAQGRRDEAVVILGGSELPERLRLRRPGRLEDKCVDVAQLGRAKQAPDTPDARHGEEVALGTPPRLVESVVGVTLDGLAFVGLAVSRTLRLTGLPSRTPLGMIATTDHCRAKDACHQIIGHGQRVSSGLDPTGPDAASWRPRAAPSGGAFGARNFILVIMPVVVVLGVVVFATIFEGLLVQVSRSAACVRASSVVSPVVFLVGVLVAVLTALVLVLVRAQ